MLPRMTPTVHLLSTPVRSLCERVPVYWTRDPLAVNCEHCQARADAQPA